MQWAIPADLGLWQAALAVVPLAIMCGVICRMLPLRAATRHSLWVATLAALVLPLILPSAPRLTMPDWSSTATSSAVPAKELAADSAGSVSAREKSTDFPIVAVQPTPTSTMAPLVSSRTAKPRSNKHRDSAPSDMGVRAFEKLGIPSSASPASGTNYNRHEHSSGESAATQTVLSNCGDKECENPPFSAEKPESTNPAPTQTIRSVDAGELTPIANGTREAVHADAKDATSIQREAWLLAWRATAATWFVAWIETARWARDGLARVPVIPTELWLGGIATVFVLHSIRIVRFRRRLRRAVPAPDTIVRSVEDVARSLGISRAPRTLMLNERISPLIWCGRRPTLILPVGLWMQLDKHGRKAILTHELAHLQRLDHWVCWLEQLVTLLYWWHPVVWWIRKRIHEEADLSCDAWVTWLMPQGRRAYAEALLRTKQFVSANGADLPAGGMAAASGRAREFARRLTMVMTQSARPRPSIMGIVLAGVIATASWLGAPAWSCPPQDELAKECNEKKTEGAAVSAITGTGTSVGVTESDSIGTVAAPKAGVTTTDRLGVRFHAPGNVHVTQPLAHVLLSQAQPMIALAHGGDENEERLAKLEAELKRLSEQLAELRSLPRGRGGSTTPAPFMPMQPTPPTPPAQPTPRTWMRAPADGPDVVRGYELPDGKLDALFELMARSDVPPRVSRNGNQIQLHASERDQEIFRQFIELIHPSGQTRSVPGAENGGAFSAPPARGRRSMRSSNAQSPQAWREIVARMQHDTQPQDAAREILAQAELWQQAAKAGSQEAREKMQSIAQRLQAIAESRQSELQNYSEMAENINQQAEQFVEQAEAMMEQANAKQAESSDKSMEEHARALEKAARELEAKARELEKEARRWEAKARKAEREVDQTTSQVDELNSMIESFDEDSDSDELPDAEPAPEAEGTLPPVEAPTPVETPASESAAPAAPVPANPGPRVY